MELASSFATFLTEIRPTANQKKDMQTGHQKLRERLLAFEGIKSIIVSEFLQGSYRRATAIRPKGDKRSDVDIIVVTKLHRDDYTPAEAMDIFVPFLDKYYKDKWTPNGRSFGIELSYVDLDLVITAAPSEEQLGILKSFSVTADETPEDTDDWRLVKSWLPVAERYNPTAKFAMELARKEVAWKTEPLLIPDREAKDWKETDPLEQIEWTWEKNRNTNDHYVNVVKALKWWRRANYTSPQYPKGYPVEHIIGQCCADGISSVAQGVTLTLEAIATQYKTEAEEETAPHLPDHGVPDHNVFHRITGADFAEFHSQVCDAAKIAREALDADTARKSSELWRELFGAKFPLSPEEKSGFSIHTGNSTPRPQRFA